MRMHTPDELVTRLQQARRDMLAARAREAEALSARKAWNDLDSALALARAEMEVVQAHLELEVALSEMKRFIVDGFAEGD